MRWLQNIAFSSPSTSSSSSSSSSSSFPSPKPSPSSTTDDPVSFDKRANLRKLRVGSIGGPKLTRARKLRHLVDKDVVGPEKSAAPDHAESLGVSRSPSESVAVPLPLPLPTRENCSSGDGEVRLVSLKEKEGDGHRGRGRGREREKFDVGDTVCR